jgi:hypothetical protein
MVLHCMLGVLSGVKMVTMRQMRVVGGLLVVARFVMGCGFLVVARSVLVMFRCLLVMMGCFLRHSQFPFAWGMDF